jgi:putative transcriptional regulator
MKLEFEFDKAKAKANLRRHGMSFDLARTVFSDPFAIERLDDREEHGEERFVIIGVAEGKALLFVAYTQREDRIRIISARRATRYEQDDYFQQKLRPMTPAAVEAAARADRDAQPLSAEDLRRMKRTPQAKIIRRALALTQEEFAVRYHIPLGTLRDWEQGRAQPDRPTQAYLKIIACEPERVERLLNSRA